MFNFKKLIIVFGFVSFIFIVGQRNINAGQEELVRRVANIVMLSEMAKIRLEASRFADRVGPESFKINIQDLEVPGDTIGFDTALSCASNLFKNCACMPLERGIFLLSLNPHLVGDGISGALVEEALTLDNRIFWNLAVALENRDKSVEDRARVDHLLLEADSLVKNQDLKRTYLRAVREKMDLQN